MPDVDCPPKTNSPSQFSSPEGNASAILAHVRIRAGKFVYSREEDKFNAETSWAFLKKVEEQSRSDGRTVVLIIDNARYHHAQMHKAWR